MWREKSGSTSSACSARTVTEYSPQYQCAKAHSVLLSSKLDAYQFTAVYLTLSAYDANSSIERGFTC